MQYSKDEIAKLLLKALNTEKKPKKPAILTKPRIEDGYLIIEAKLPLNLVLDAWKQ